MRLLMRIKNSRYMQYLATLTATLSVASLATHIVWSSPTLPQLTSENSPIGTTLTNEEASWVASICLLSALPGSFVSAILVERIGRRGTLLLAGLPLFAPWIAIIFARSLLVLLIARFVAGVGIAVATTVATMYIGEITEKDIRGKLGTWFTILKLTGCLFVYSVGPFVSYTTLSLSCSLLPVIFMVLFYFMPESPYYFIKISRKEEARGVLIRLASNDVDEEIINKQLEEMEDTVEGDIKNKATLKDLFSEQHRKAVVIMLGIKTLQQFSGSNAIAAYTQTIIQSTSSSISPEVSSIICGFIQLPAVLVASVLVDKTGRKPLLITSAIGCAIALAGEGTYFYLQDVTKTEMGYLSWLPTASLVLLLIMNPIGIFTIPYVLLGELFATNIKGIAVSVFTLYGSLLAFLVVKFFKPISDSWGMHTMFWMYAGMCTLGSIFVLVILPETKSKTFAEIQKKLNKKKSLVLQQSGSI